MAEPKIMNEPYVSIYKRYFAASNESTEVGVVGVRQQDVTEYKISYNWKTWL